MITALFMAMIAGRVSFAETAFTVFVKSEPAGCATDVFTMGATFWKPVMCFGSVSTVYFDGARSGGSVEKTSAASTEPESSAAYGDTLPTDAKVAFERPYCLV